MGAVALRGRGGDEPRHRRRRVEFSTSWLTEWYDYDRRILNALGLAPSNARASLIHVGTARKVPSDRVLPYLAEIVTDL